MGTHTKTETINKGEPMKTKMTFIKPDAKRIKNILANADIEISNETANMLVKHIDFKRTYKQGSHEIKEKYSNEEIVTQALDYLVEEEVKIPVLTYHSNPQINTDYINHVNVSSKED